MWSWQSVVIGLVVVGATAQVLAQDTAQPEPRLAPPSAPQAGPHPGPQQSPPLPKSTTVPIPRQTIDGAVPHVPQPAPSQQVDANPLELGRAAHSQDRAGEAPSKPPLLVTGDRPRPRYARDDVRDRPIFRRGYRPAEGPGYRGADWPLDQNRRYEGPRDAYGGRWIYVRPARRPVARYGNRDAARYAAFQPRMYGDQGFRPARPYTAQPAWREPWPDRRFARRYD